MKLAFNVGEKRFNIDIFTFFVTSFLYLMFISDGVTKYLYVRAQGDGFYRVSIFMRIIFEVIAILYLLRNINRKTLVYFSMFILLFLSFMIGQIAIVNIHDFFESFITFNKYIFLFIVYLFLERVLAIENKNREIIFKVLSVVFILNIAFSFMGLFFDIEFFKTFPNIDYRYGFNGVFFAQNESSFFIIIIISLLFFRAFYENGSKIFLLLSLLQGVFCGMKAVYIYMFFLSVFFIYILLKRQKYLWLTRALTSLILFFSILGSFLFERLQMYTLFFQETLINKGFFYMMLSGRNKILLNDSVLVMKEWTFLNYLFGGREVRYIMEMDFFDLILFFGCIGTLVYLLLFYQFFIKNICKHIFFIFFMFLFLSLSFFGGHFLTSSSSAVYFSLIILYFKDYLIKNEKNIINK